MCSPTGCPRPKPTAPSTFQAPRARGQDQGRPLAPGCSRLPAGPSHPTGGVAVLAASQPLPGRHPVGPAQEEVLTFMTRSPGLPAWGPEPPRPAGQHRPVPLPPLSLCGRCPCSQRRVRSAPPPPGPRKAWGGVTDAGRPLGSGAAGTELAKDETRERGGRGFGRTVSPQPVGTWWQLPLSPTQPLPSPQPNPHPAPKGRREKTDSGGDWRERVLSQ